MDELGLAEPVRNPLVYLPLALALPVEFALAPLMIITQTLLES